MEDFIVRMTAGVCVAFYLIAILVALRYSMGTLAAKWWWTAAWAVLVLHTAAAFHLRHEWSPRIAADHVAQRTEQVVGFYWGGGIWFNYALMLVWGVDVALRWTTGSPKAWAIFVQLFLALMVASATVVFGPAYWWIVVILVAAAAWVARSGHRGNSQPASRTL